MSNPATLRLKRLLREAFDEEMDALKESATLEFKNAISSIQNWAIAILEAGVITEADMRQVNASLLNVAAEKELALKAAATSALLRFVGKLSAAILSGALSA